MKKRVNVEDLEPGQTGVVDVPYENDNYAANGHRIVRVGYGAYLESGSGVLAVLLVDGSLWDDDYDAGDPLYVRDVGPPDTVRSNPQMSVRDIPIGGKFVDSNGMAWRVVRLGANVASSRSGVFAIRDGSDTVAWYSDDDGGDELVTSVY